MVKQKCAGEEKGAVLAVCTRVAEAEARKSLTPRRRLFKSRKALQKIELLYLPYFWASILTEFKGKRENLTVAADALEGVAAFPNVKFVQFEERPLPQPLPFLLSESQVEAALLAAARDFSVQVGIRQKQPLKILEISSIQRIYYPFWLAYYTTPKGLTFTALDAISGAIQGVKMRQVFVKALKMLQKLGTTTHKKTLRSPETPQGERG